MTIHSNANHSDGDPMSSAPNEVLVGNDKDIMKYVQAVLSQAHQYPTVHVKARGQATSKAIDAAEICLHRFLKGWTKTIETGTTDRPKEAAKYDDKGKVSFIEITLTKPVE